MKSLCFLIALVLSSIQLFAVIDTIPKENYSLVSYSSDNTSHPVTHAWDNDTTTWWALYNTAGYSLPGTLVLDLGAVENVCGFSYLPNPAQPANNAKSYEFYTSLDGENWDLPESVGTYSWVNSQDVTRKNTFFGTVSAQYIYLVYTETMNTTSDNIHTGDFFVYSNSEPGTGQLNQWLIVAPLESIYFSTNEDIELSASSSVGLDVEFEVLSGPVEINGTTLSFTGGHGMAEIRVFSDGNSTYYPVEKLISFQVDDLNTFMPTVMTQLSDELPIQMTELNPFLIQARASIQYPEFLEIENISVAVDGEVLVSEIRNGLYQTWWDVQEYGDYTVEITAFASNGNQTTKTFDLTVTDEVVSQNVLTFDEDVINYPSPGRYFTGTYVLPQFVACYDQIIANFTTTCPDGNCDDWDRYGYIEVQTPNGEWVEFLRYVTPYGVGCIHSLDVTDYASVLQGEVNIRMFINTWGTGGWGLTLDFDYQKGTPEYTYSFVDVIWRASYPFGDLSNLQPVDTAMIELDDCVESAKLSLVSTGHGWGSNNTGNAAEFYHAVHEIKVVGQAEWEQDLWMDCDPNPDGCTGQQGTWTYDRAGWCPGSIAMRFYYPLDDFLTQESFDLAYIFNEDYVDYCHLSNPDCVSGVTCTDCSAGSNPNYYVAGNLISYTNVPITTGLDDELVDFQQDGIQFTVMPNPTSGIFRLNATSDFENATLMVYDVSGALLKGWTVRDQNVLNGRTFSVEEFSAGTYFLVVQTLHNQGTCSLIVK